MNNKPQSHTEVLIYFVENLWRTPLIIARANNDNELELKYAGVDIEACLIYDTRELVIYDPKNYDMIICWEDNSSLEFECPILVLSLMELSNIHFDTLLASIDERIAKLEVQRLEFMASRMNSRQSLFECALTIYDLTSSGFSVSQKFLLDMYDWDEQIISRSFSILISLHIISVNSIVTMIDRDKVVRILNKYIETATVPL